MADLNKTVADLNKTVTDKEQLIVAAHDKVAHLEGINKEKSDLIQQLETDNQQLRTKLESY